MIFDLPAVPFNADPWFGLENSVYLQKAAHQVGYKTQEFNDMYLKYQKARDAGRSSSETFEKFLQSPTWRDNLELAESTGKAKVPFPKGGTSAENFANAILELEKMPSYAKYADMLEKEGIATRAAIQTELEAIVKAKGAKGFATVDDLRSAFKEKYRARVMAKMTKASMTAEEKHQAFLRITEQLSSSDKGKLAEDWYRLTFSPKATPQVPYTKESMAKQGIAIAGRDGGNLRYADLVDGNKVQEIKHISGNLSAEELEQFRDYLAIATKRGTISKDGQKFTIQRITYVFTNPEGAKANVVFIKDQLKAGQNSNILSFEVFNAKGEKMLFNDSNYKQIDSFLAR
jgi:hypothetical protein